MWYMRINDHVYCHLMNSTACHEVLGSAVLGTYLGKLPSFRVENRNLLVWILPTKKPLFSRIGPSQSWNLRSIVSYNKTETKIKSLNGKVACEISKHIYGVDH